MPASSEKYITMCYDNYPDQQEFVFAMKGRPFSMLSSQKLPVPTTSLIDFNLVSELGLKMTDLQCSKFTFGGQRFRILGKISQTVQTITDGVISGTVHLRASVVEGLRSVFDSHSIAGQKLTDLLSRKVSHTSSQQESPSTSPSNSTRSVKTPAKVKTSSASKRNSPKPSNLFKTNHPSKPSPVPQSKCSPCTPQASSPPPPPSPDDDYLYGRTSYVSAPHGRLSEVEVGIMFHDKKENMVETILTCQRLSAGYSNPELRPGDAVLFRTFDYWTQPDYEIDPIMLSLDDHVIYRIFTTEEEAELTSQGIHIPELPPELYPDGYYDC